MEAGEAELRRLGHRNVVLWVLEDNPRARRFYERAGWEADGAQRGIEIFGMTVPEVRYAKTLTSADRSICHLTVNISPRSSDCSQLQLNESGAMS